MYSFIAGTVNEIYCCIIVSVSINNSLRRKNKFFNLHIPFQFHFQFLNLISNGNQCL